MSRDVPIGWHHTTANKATILGNGTLGNITVAVRALIEAPTGSVSGSSDASLPRYVMLGLNGGSSNRTAGPYFFYVDSPHADALWFNATHWGCQMFCRPTVCSQPHPVAFGLGVWHAISFSEAPGPTPGTRFMSATLDDALLFNITASTLRNNGMGGYVMLRTGAHHAMFDDLAITSNQV